MVDASSRVDVWLGSSLGLMKGVSLEPLRCTNYLPGGLSLTQTDKSREMLCMCREQGSSEGTLYVGLRNGVVQEFDCRERRFTVECDTTTGVGTLVGVAKHNSVLITCTDRGALSFWPAGEEKWEAKVGSQTSCMAGSGSVALQVATGGRENALKLWDGHHIEAPVFTAKNVRPDKLGLRVPVWVNQVVFTPDSGPQPILVTGTGYGQVRLYDTRAQRRPIFSSEYGTEPITALDVTPDSRFCVVGNSTGDLGRFDLRQGGLLSQYRGFGGAVTAARVSKDGSVLAACGLDRYLRVYHVEKPTLLHQVYVKLQCRCLLFSETYSSASGEGRGVGEGERRGQSRGEGENEEEESDGEDDVLWAAMVTVGDDNRKSGVRGGGRGGVRGGGGKRKKEIDSTHTSKRWKTDKTNLSPTR